MTHDQIVALLRAPTPGAVRMFRVDGHHGPEWYDLPTPMRDKHPVALTGYWAANQPDLPRCIGWQCATGERDLAKWWPQLDLQECITFGGRCRVVEVPHEYCHDCGTQWCFDPAHAKDVLQ